MSEGNKIIKERIESEIEYSKFQKSICVDEETKKYWVGKIFAYRSILLMLEKESV